MHSYAVMRFVILEKDGLRPTGRSPFSQMLTVGARVAAFPFCQDVAGKAGWEERQEPKANAYVLINSTIGLCTFCDCVA